MYVEGSAIEDSPSSGETISPLIRWHGALEDVPCTVVVASDDSRSWLWGISIISSACGSMKVIVEWSSMIARPITVRPVEGWVIFTGHVLL